MQKKKFCNATNCRYPYSHILSNHICSICNQYGHGQCDHNNSNRINNLRNTAIQSIPTEMQCRVHNCNNKWTHTTEGHQCYQCGLFHGSTECIISSVEKSHGSHKYINNNINIYDRLQPYNNIYIIDTIGMGCLNYIRKKNSIISILFMHSSMWGQYGTTEDLDNRPLLYKFINGLTELSSVIIEERPYNNNLPPPPSLSPSPPAPPPTSPPSVPPPVPPPSATQFTLRPPPPLSPPSRPRPPPPPPSAPISRAAPLNPSPSAPIIQHSAERGFFQSPPPTSPPPPLPARRRRRPAPPRPPPYQNPPPPIKNIICPGCRTENNYKEIFDIKGLDQKCIICFENDITKYFSKCKHAYICDSCFYKL